jgi:hypothetical protein
MQLKREFLRLLHKADPEVTENDYLVHEFASHLAALTDDWATGSPTFDVRKEWLAQWIEENRAQPLEAAASASGELELLDAEGDFDSDAEAEAGVDG